MRFFRYKNKVVALGVVFSAALTLAGTASAAAGWYTLERAGNACRSANPNVAAWYGALVNGDWAIQRIWCPLDTAYIWGPSHVYVNVSSGWATTTSCSLNQLTSATTSWSYSATSVSHNSSTNLDTVNFINVPLNWYTVGSNVECVLPSGGKLFDYSERLYQYYDWSSW
jgi:hypothetical protein